MARVNQGFRPWFRYYSGKANVVADSLSRKAYCNTIMINKHQPKLHKEYSQLDLQLLNQGHIAMMEV